MLGGDDAVPDRLAAVLEAAHEERAAAAEPDDGDVVMQLHDATVIDAGLLTNVELQF